MMLMQQRTLRAGVVAARSQPRVATIVRATPAGGAKEPAEKPIGKIELVEIIAEETGHTKTIVSEIVNKAITIIQEEVAAGQKITLTGFGSFEKRHRKARVGNNPRQPGAKIQIAATDVPAFSAGAEFKRIVKGEPPKAKAAPKPKAAPKTPAAPKAKTAAKAAPKAK